MAQALPGFTSEARWLRFLPARMPGAFRYLPGQSVTRSELAGWAKYGFCRSPSRWFWGLRPAC
ncbi:MULTISPECIES: hypothetical protein [unclassified Amycolatopsis]|uniref:hypothetical protein n=1 Tax=unclassified Amycolatopsis TaxID=2618356 RepID=UPI00287BAA1E|nr:MULTISPECIES: hypothetical protein [unclassified Amycolatopsis]